MTELPNGWRRSTLGELGNYWNGRGFKKSEWRDSGRPIIRIQNLTGTSSAYNHFQGDVDERHVARSGDLLVSWAATLGVYEWRGPEAVVNQHIFKVDSSINQRFHRYLIEHVLDDLNTKTHGSGMVHITRKRFDETPVLIPESPDEQQRIVEAIEEQFSRLDVGVESLQRAKRNLARLRASVLSSAVSGELLGLSPDSSSAGGLFRVPPSWVWRGLGEVAEVSGGIQKQPKRKPNGNAYPYLRVANVQRGQLDLDEIHEMELFGDELERFRLETGDLLVVEGNGSQSQIGRSAVWDGQIADCVHQNHIIRVRPGSDLDPHFLNLYWNSPPAVSRITSVAASTSGLYTLSTSKLKAVPVPLPPLETQKSIVSEVDRQFSILDALTETVVSAQLHSARLRQAILADAFAGRLIPDRALLEVASA